MKVRRNDNFIECIMDSEDLERYDLELSEIKDPSSKDKICEKLQEILVDINDELDEEDKMTFDSPMNVEMSIRNSKTVLIRIHTQLIETNEEDNSFKNDKKVFDKNEIKDLAFSFKNLDDCILFAKQIHNLGLILIERKKNLSKEDLKMTDEEDLEIPDDIPDFLVNHLKQLRKIIVEQINNGILESFDRTKKFEGFKTSLYKMNNMYYFICRDISFNSMSGIPEEFYLNDIENEPTPAYIEEHGEVIIKENAADSLAII